MKAIVLSINELENVMKLTKLQTTLVERLTTYLRDQEFQLERLKYIKEVSQHLLDHKNSTWWKLVDKDLKKQMERFAK